MDSIDKLFPIDVEVIVTDKDAPYYGRIGYVCKHHFDNSNYPIRVQFVIDDDDDGEYVTDECYTLKELRIVDNKIRIKIKMRELI